MGIFKKGKMEIAKAKEVGEVFTVIGFSSVGFLFADSHKELIPKIEKWHAMFNTANGFIDAQALLKEGLDQLVEKISNKPFIQFQLKQAMALMELSYDGPVIEADLSKYKKCVDAFMTGVLSAK